MKELFLLISCIVLFTCISDAQDSVSISDFRYPETRAIDWKAGLSGNFGSSSSENVSRYPGNSYSPSSSSNSGSLNFNSNFQFYHAKDNHDQSISLGFSGRVRSESQEDEIAENPSYSFKKYTYKSWNYDATIDWSYLHYLSNEGFHYIGSISTQYRKSSSETNYTYNVAIGDSVVDQYNRSYSIYFSGKMGFGYGRMRDGTVVFQALRILERLQEDGLLTKSLNKEEVMSLVDRIMKKREYQVNYERYEKYFIQDIANELVESGIIAKDFFTPFSIVRMMETFNRESIQPRFFGWRIYYLFNDNHDQSMGDYSYGFQDRHIYDDDWSWWHTIGFEYGLPISLRTHLTVNSKFEMPTRDYKRKFNINANISLSHELGEKIDVKGTYTFYRNADNSSLGANGSYDRYINHRIQGNFVYFLEDKVRFSIDPSYSWYFGHYYPDVTTMNLYGWSIDSGFSLSFGLNYNIY